MLVKYLFSLLLVTIVLQAHTKEHITLEVLQNNALHHIGYYMAQKKSFYKNLNLDVYIKNVQHESQIHEDILENSSAYYGVGSVKIFNAISKEKPLVIVAAMLQESLEKQNILFDDILFTNKKEATFYYHRVKKFKKASLQGWRYALTHIDESVELLFNEHNSNATSKAALKQKLLAYKHASHGQSHIGSVKKNKLLKAYENYADSSGLYARVNILEYVVLDKSRYTLSKKQAHYLEGKKELTSCYLSNFRPFSSYSNSQVEGLSIDFLQAIAKKYHVDITYVKNDTLKEYFNNITTKKCDVGVVSLKNISKIPMTMPTVSYVEDDLVLATALKEPYVTDIRALKHKKIGIFGNAKNLHALVKKHYPNFELVDVDIADSLKRVVTGELYGVVGVSMNVRYDIATKYPNEVKIMTKLLDEKLQGSFLVHEESMMLLSILNRAINEMSRSAMKDQIIASWYNQKVEKSTDFILLIKIVSTLALLFFSISYFVIQQRNKKLNEHVANIQSFFDATLEMIVISDKNQKVVEINQAGVEILGYEFRHEILGRSVGEFVAPFDLQTVIEAMKHEIQPHYEVHLIKKDGSYITMYGGGRNIVRNGEVMRLATLIDLTEIKEQEKQLLQQSRLAQLGEMVSMIAHQWRQPLSAISTAAISMKMHLELSAYNFESRDDEEKFNRYYTHKLKEIETFVLNLNSTIEDFRSFYKPSKDKASSSVRIMVDKALNMIGSDLKTHAISVALDLQTQKSIDVYENELIQVLINILQNAKENFIEHKHQEANIIIKSYESGDALEYSVIEIRDNGGGIDEAIISKVFDPYFSTKDERNGTGLGLYMSKTIVENHHHGIFSVHNTAEGVCFSIKIKNQQL